jgi:vancomycin resistance protein YoaR
MSRQTKDKKKNKWRLVVVSLIFVLVCTFGTFGVLNLVESNNIRAAHAEVQRAIDETVQNLTESEIKFVFDEYNFTHTFADFLDYVNENLEPTFNADKVRDVLEHIDSQVTSSNGIDTQAAMYDAMNVLSGTTENTIVSLLEIWIEDEDIAPEDVIKDIIGTFYTHFNPRDTGRNANIYRAAELINNFTLAPGEIFSMNDIIGPININNGYHIALVIREGEFVEGIGGGVCQVSSTLYMAALFAELEIVQRRAHSRFVGYMPPGFDAVLSIPTLNLRFANNTPADITIETIVDFQRSRLTVNIWGQETRPPERTISFESRRVAATSEWITYHLYKLVNYNGNVSRYRINASAYRPERADAPTYYEAIGGEPSEYEQYEGEQSEIGQSEGEQFEDEQSERGQSDGELLEGEQSERGQSEGELLEGEQSERGQSEAELLESEQSERGQSEVEQSEDEFTYYEATGEE